MVAGYDGPGGEPGDPQGILPPACVTPSLRPALPALGKPGDVLSLKPRGREEERRGAGGGRRNLSHTARLASGRLGGWGGNAAKLSEKA